MAKKPKTTVVPKITGGGSKYDSLNAGIDKLNKSLAGGITGVEGTRPNQRTYFTDNGAVGINGQKIGGGSETAGSAGASGVIILSW